MATGSHIGCPKITLYNHFTSIPQFLFLWYFFYKMTAGGHFGCPKITFGRISGHFRSIRNFLFLIFFQNGRRHPSCMSEFTFDRISGHFRWIHNFFLVKFLFCEIFLQNGCRRPFWMSKNHFRSHFWPFQMNTNFYFFWKCLNIWCPKITFDLISIHFTSIRFFFWNFWQNGWRRPFWMSEIHFRSHFWPFQIETQL